jgi:flagellar hook-basal body complex protein FliE
MSDPLGLIGGAGGNAAAGRVDTGARGGNGPRPGEPSFKDVLLDNLRQADALQADATKAIEDLQTGRRDDLEGVILAAQKAELAFRMLQGVRNKVVEAYNEIKQMRV